MRLAFLPLVLLVAIAGCGGGGDEAAPRVTSAVTGAVVTPTSTSTSTSSPASSSGTSRTLLPSSIAITGTSRVTVGPLSMSLPPGWTVERGKADTSLDDEPIRAGDRTCLRPPDVGATDGIPFDCPGVLVMVGSAFDNAAEYSSPYDPDSAYQWYRGTDVPSCSPDFPLVRSAITASSLAPIGSRNAAFRRLDVQCEKRPTVHKAVSWTLPTSRVAVVSLFRAGDAEALWAGATLG